jgi:hypothetical protein
MEFFFDFSFDVLRICHVDFEDYIAALLVSGNILDPNEAKASLSFSLTTMWPPTLIPLRKATKRCMKSSEMCVLINFIWVLVHPAFQHPIKNSSQKPLGAGPNGVFSSQ